MLNRILSKNFLYSFLIVFITGLLSRYFIYIYCDVNVFTDMFNKISLIYYGIMSVYIHTVKEIVNIFTVNVLMMDASGVNPPVGAGAGSGSGAAVAGGATEVTPNLIGGAGENTSRNNQTWIKVKNGKVSSWMNSAAVNGTWGDPNQGVASIANGPLNISDPYNQGVRGYDNTGTNQPFAQNLAAGLDHQYMHLSRQGQMNNSTLNDDHQNFLLGFLYYNDRQAYNKVIGADNKLVWGKLYNSKKLRDSLVNTL